jgi:cell division protein FtsB
VDASDEARWNSLNVLLAARTEQLRTALESNEKLEAEIRRLKEQLNKRF